MTNLEDIFHYLEMQVDYVIGKKITFCQSIYFKKIFHCFKIIKYKPFSNAINLKVASFLFYYNRNTDKKTIK